jgi:hypothetical protein
MKQNIILWLGTLIIVFLAGYLSSAIGPSYPAFGTISVEGQKVSFKFDKIYNGSDRYNVLIKTDVADIKAYLLWREVTPDLHAAQNPAKSYSPVWNREVMTDSGFTILGKLPKHFPGERIAYRVELNYNGKQYFLPEINPVIITLWSKVNSGVMQIYYFLLFGGLILAVRTGLEVFKDPPKLGIYTIFTLIFFFLYTVCLVPLKRTYELNALNHFVPPLKSIITYQSVALLILWIIGLILIFNYKKNKVIPLTLSFLTIVIYTLIHY